ncbi:HET-domain-containing protein, partial [Stipitochalara longipes BDJ]
MRLINIETLALHEFDDVRIPPYYILSHRWEKDEITFQDVKKSRNRGHYGWSKVKNFCQFVKNHPIDDPRCERVVYIWIDTCCIDKRNSAELSEAINSMYQWYRKAVACYAYLNDVPAGGEDRVHEYMRRSEWFTRGWTLQELLAPVYTIFVDKDWTGVLGDGSALASLLSEITGIPEKLVNRDRSYKNVPRPNTGDFSIAQIMSWASKREYTKKEDVAYGLMGLFGVHMPLLYGEGGVKAFQRLQQEILKISCDESIFAWFCEDEKWLSGMLAPSPENFSHSG